MAKCALPGCNKKARRKFCCNKHKDKFHNRNNPRGYFAHLNRASPEFDHEDDFHPFDPHCMGEDKVW